MFSIFATTFVVFPGVAIEVQPDHDWYAILVVTLYNAGDVLGRLGSSYKAILLASERYLWGMTLIRFVLFVPLLIVLATTTAANGEEALLAASLVVCFLLSHILEVGNHGKKNLCPNLNKL